MQLPFIWPSTVNQNGYVNTMINRYFPEAHEDNIENKAKCGGKMQFGFPFGGKMKLKKQKGSYSITYNPRDRFATMPVMSSDNTRVAVPVETVENMRQRQENALKTALKNSQKRVESSKPFNNYTQANDLNVLQGIKAWIFGNIANRGTSNCTLNATNCFGPSFTMAKAQNIVLDKNGNQFRQIDGNEIPIGALTIQSLPNVPDTSENAKYHTMIFAGLADSNYVNQFGDTISVGDTLFNYSNGRHRNGDFRQRPMQVLRNNNGKTYFRYFVPK